jgi:hypothetical protein
LLCMHARLYVCMYVCMYVYMYVCMYVCMGVCSFVSLRENRMTSLQSPLPRLCVHPSAVPLITHNPILWTSIMVICNHPSQQAHLGHVRLPGQRARRRGHHSDRLLRLCREQVHILIHVIRMYRCMCASDTECRQPCLSLRPLTMPPRHNHLLCDDPFSMIIEIQDPVNLDMLITTITCLS